jgi:hypothetical protein
LLGRILNSIYPASGGPATSFLNLPATPLMHLDSNGENISNNLTFYQASKSTFIAVASVVLKQKKSQWMPIALLLIIFFLMTHLKLHSQNYFLQHYDQIYHSKETNVSVDAFNKRFLQIVHLHFNSCCLTVKTYRRTAVSFKIISYRSYHYSFSSLLVLQDNNKCYNEIR